MIPANIKATIFDFDGIVVDTELLGAKVLAIIIKKNFKIKLSDKDKRQFFGTCDLDSYKFLIKKYNLTANADELLEQHNSIYDNKIFQIRETLPGVKSALKKIKQRGLKTAVCSGSYPIQITTVLKNLGLQAYFDLIVSADDTSKHKPNPEPYILTAQKLNLLPKDCLVFEDSENGIKSAKKAGMYCVGVKIGNHGTQNLEKADQAINTFKELE